MSDDKSDPYPWRRPAIYYGRRYIPGFTAERTLLDEATGKNVVFFDTYDVSEVNRIRSVYSATPKITNMFMFEYGSGNTLTPDIVDGLLPLSNIQLEIWGYNFAELPHSRIYLNTLHVYVSATPGVFDDNLYKEYNLYNHTESLETKNPPFSGIEISYELIPVLDRARSITQKSPRTLNYTRRNKLKFKLPEIHVDEGCVDIILANAAGYSKLNTLTNDLICDQLNT